MPVPYDPDERAATGAEAALPPPTPDHRAEPGLRYAANCEWLEADGLGGFASGTVGGVRTRRYHAWLLTARTPPTGRVVLVNGAQMWLETDAGTEPLSSQAYASGVVEPDGAARLIAFEPEPWPRWTWRLANGTEVEQELVVPHDRPATLVVWRRVAGTGRALLHVKLLLSGRDMHQLHRQNDAFPFGVSAVGDRVRFGNYAELPPVIVRHNGRWEEKAEWFREFSYEEERRRGLDHVEDLASAGEFHFDLDAGDAVMMLCAGPRAEASAMRGDDAVGAAKRWRASERLRRARFPTRLHRAADAYLVKRGAGSTVIAGYPWFADWGRDTFIALRGLCLAGDRLAEAGDILLEWSVAVSDGLLPNRFVEEGVEPEYNAVDASLWYVVALQEWLELMTAREGRLPAAPRARLLAAADSILEGYMRGARYGIRVDADGLVAAGEPGYALTWMDARVNERAITGRIGKPVEVQALWLNALAFAAERDERWREPLERGRRSFAERFWNDAAGGLYDVVDVDHVASTVDASFRPNQVFAVGGLPIALIDGERARKLVAAVEQRLWTPMGLRTLAPGEPGYIATYEGDMAKRDAAYHQGIVWPWLIGPFVEAWVRVHGATPAARDQARRRFVFPLLAHLEQAGLGHVSEIADATPPYQPHGCPFQAWSVSELLRAVETVVGEPAEGN